MNGKIVLLASLLLSGSASAAVYKWVDEQGNVHYGDLPPGQVPAETVKLPGITTYQHRAIPQATQPESPAPNAFAGYTQAEIVQPENGSAVRANDQKVTVVVALEPALQPDHRVAILLDGQQVGEPFAGVSVQLDGVYRGGHRLQARVVDAAGKTLTETPAVTFTLRKATVIPPSPVPNPPPPAN